MANTSSNNLSPSKPSSTTSHVEGVSGFDTGGFVLNDGVETTTTTGFGEFRTATSRYSTTPTDNFGITFADTGRFVIFSDCSVDSVNQAAANEKETRGLVPVKLVQELCSVCLNCMQFFMTLFSFFP